MLHRATLEVYQRQHDDEGVQQAAQRRDSDRSQQHLSPETGREQGRSIGQAAFIASGKEQLESLQILHAHVAGHGSCVLGPFGIEIGYRATLGLKPATCVCVDVFARQEKEQRLYYNGAAVKQWGIIVI